MNGYTRPRWPEKVRTSARAFTPRHLEQRVPGTGGATLCRWVSGWKNRAARRVFRCAPDRVLAAETCRILMRVGIFSARATRKTCRTGLAAPAVCVSFQTGQARGMAGTGHGRLMAAQPTPLHQRIGFMSDSARPGSARFGRKRNAHRGLPPWSAPRHA